MSFMKWIGMGQPPKGATEGVYNEDERYFGFENFGNTCYCNSVVQALYYCKPFRESVTNYPNGPVASFNPNMPIASPTSPAATSFGSTPLNSPIISGANLSKPNSVPANYKSLPPSNVGFSALLSSGNKEKKEDGPRPSAGRGGAPPKMESMKALAMTSETAGPNVTLSVPGMDETMYAALKDLFWKISSQKRKSGVIAPTAFINKLRKDNELFRSTMHQDAHEFLNYLLNTIADNIEDYQRKMMKEAGDRQNQNLQQQSVNGSLDSSLLPDSSSERSASTQSNSLQSGQLHNPPPTTWVRQLFEGVLTNETRCLTCETVTSKDESFLDLSIDIEQNSSVTACLRQFSASEMLCHKNKFFCDVCSGLQEAEKRMKIKKLPNLLALHLKRFKYQEKLQRYIKLSYRVMFPMELRLFNTSDDAENSDRMYELWAIVVHIGGGPHHGHYVSIIRNNGIWLCFDDDAVSAIDEDQITKYFGDNSGVGSGYVLFYQAVDFDVVSTGISTAPWDQSASATINVNGLPEASSLPVYINGTISTASSTTESSQLGQMLPSSNTGQIPRNPQPSSTPSHSRSASTSSRELLNGTTPTPSTTSNEEQPQPDPVIPPQKEEKEKKIRLPGFSRSTSSKDIGVVGLGLLSKRPSLSAGMGILPERPSLSAGMGMLPATVFENGVPNGAAMSPTEEKKGFFVRSNTRKGKKEKEREKEKEKEKEALKMIATGVET